ncbi:MAG: hypothetical protein II367_05665 [Treponema sp.]|nr:hypothetical protein [Treponema sp.]
MKKFVLLMLLSLFVMGCGKDYGENVLFYYKTENPDDANWIVFNTCDFDVDLVIDDVTISSKANTTNSYNACYGKFSASPSISFPNNSTLHLKGEEGYFYSNGNSYHSLTIKKQSLVPFYVSYLGGKDVYVTCRMNDDYVRTAAGKERKFKLEVGTSSAESGTGYDGDVVYTAQNVYESQIPYYIFYIFNSDATEKDRADFKAKDYIDIDEMPYLTRVYGAIRYLETLGTYTEYFHIAGSSN